MANATSWAQNEFAGLAGNATGQSGSGNPYGLTDEQMQALIDQVPLTGGGQNTQGGQYGTSSGVSSAGKDLSQTSQTLGILNTLGLLGSGAQGASQQGAPSSTGVPVSPDAMNAATNLGAAALGMGAVYNPVPTGATGPGGVGKIGSPVSTTDIPGVPSKYANMPGVFAAAPSLQPSGGTPTSQMQQYFADARAKAGAGQMDPSTVDPTMAKQYWDAAHPPAPQAPAPNAAPYNATPTPWATAQAPAAPGPPSMAAHTAGLENAGKALYAHFGGDPDSATHADIMNFHNQLGGLLGQAAQAVGGTPFGPAPAGAQGYTAGIPPGISAAGPQKMATGGWVYGDDGTTNGDDDTVTKKLTPGEYVIPKEQAKRLTEIPRLQQSQSAQAPSTQQPQNASASDQSSSTAPAAPGGYTGPSAAELRAQANRFGSGATSAQDMGDTVTGMLNNTSPSSEDMSGTLTDMLANPNQGGGSTGPNTASQAAGVASGLAAGLASAAQAYAKSIGSWKWQQADFSAPKGQSGPATVFQQEQVA